MKKQYDADPGFCTVNQAVARISEELGISDSTTKGHYYRTFINLAKNKLIKSRKHGRSWWLDEMDVENYIKDRISSINKEDLISRNINHSQVTIDYVKDMILLLEKAGTEHEIILKLIKEKLEI